jgi:hypothetical protein
LASTSPTGITYFFLLFAAPVAAGAFFAVGFATGFALTGFALAGAALVGFALAGAALAGAALAGAALAGFALAGFAATGFALAGLALAGFALTAVALTGFALAGLALAGFGMTQPPRCDGPAYITLFQLGPVLTEGLPQVGEFFLISTMFKATRGQVCSRLILPYLSMRRGSEMSQVQTWRLETAWKCLAAFLKQILNK